MDFARDGRRNGSATPINGAPARGTSDAPPEPAPIDDPKAAQPAHSVRESLVLAIVLALGAGVVGLQGWLARRGGAPIQIHRGAEAPPPALDLNRASALELMQLPGIGPKTAAAIVDDRNVNGPFTDVDDLKRVKGIGAKTVERLRPYLTRSNLPAEKAPTGSTGDGSDPPDDDAPP